MSLFLASSITGQGFKVYRNFDLKSSDFDDLPTQKLDDINFSMMEFHPHNDTLSFSAVFEGYIVEDTRMKTLNIFINTRKSDENYPFKITLKHYEFNKFDFNIEPSIFANAEECVNYTNIFNKIKNLYYRRFYICDLEHNIILTASCPSLNSVPPKELIDYYSKFNKLEKKVGHPLYPNRIYKRLNLDDLDDLSELAINKNLDLLTKNDNRDRQTIIKLYNKSDQTIPVLISELNGWFNYRSMDITFNKNDKENKKAWNKIIESQGAITFVGNIRGILPEEFCKEIISKKLLGEDDILNSINNLVNSYKSNDKYETKLVIDFKAANADKTQLIEVIVESADQDLNLLEKFMEENNYIQAIPLLEKFNTFPENLAYAYVMNSEYDKAIELSNNIIKNNPYSVAHMTKGLAYVGKKEYNLALNAYKLGTYLIEQWYPIALNNLTDFIESKEISNQEIEKIIKTLSTPKKNKTISQRCYCGSSLSIKNCHAKEYFE